MFGKTSTLFSLALLAASSVSGLVLPRHRNLNRDLQIARAPTPVEVAVRAVATQPADWTSHNLEDYMTYHIRYMALDCEDKHNTTFFTTCCHPRKAGASTTGIDASCIPSSKLLASASERYGPEPTEDCSGGDATSTATHAPTATSEPEPEDCDGEGDGEGESTTTHHSSATPKPTSSSVKVTSSSSKPTSSSAKPTSSSLKATGVAGNLGGEPTVASSSSVKPTTTSSTHTTSSTPKASPTSTSSKTSAAAEPTGSVYSGGVATYYTQNGVAGACGDKHSDSDLIAAIDQDRYGDSSRASSLCGKQVKITNTDNKKSVSVTIADDCPTCKNSNSIDLSVGAFTQIATKEQGEVPITWEFL